MFSDDSLWNNCNNSLYINIIFSISKYLFNKAHVVEHIHPSKTIFFLKFQSKKMYPLISVTRNTHNAWGKLRDGISMQFVNYVKRFIRLSYWESKWGEFTCYAAQCLDRMMGICCSALLNEVNFLILLSNIYTNNLWNVEMPFTPLNVKSFFPFLLSSP